jgi:uncharacterized protein (DUF885 family)
MRSLADRLHAQRARAQGFAIEGLDELRQLEREVLLTHIDGELFWLESARWQERSPSYYEDALDPEHYVGREYAPLRQRMQAYIAYARAVPAAVAQIRRNLKTPMVAPFVAYGHIVFGGLASFYRDEVPGIFRAVDDSLLQEELRGANAGAIDAMQGLDAWLQAQERGATQDFALGGARFLEMLQATEGIDIPLERLRRIGQDDLDRNLQAMREACAAWAPGKSLAQCTERAGADKSKEPVVEAATHQLDGLKQFVLAHDLVSIPGPEQALVRAAPAYKLSNGAYILIPGPWEQGLPATYFIAPPDPRWTAAEQEQYIPGKGDLLFTSVHEVWPGHFLHFQHVNRTPSLILKVFTSYAFVEGWAHYGEEMMWEAGLAAGDPQMHIGQLTNALLRNVRFLSAIGLHSGTMTLAQSEAMFRDVAFQDPGSARQQAMRGTYDPEYLKYTLGKLMIRKLREDWTAGRGHAAWKEFHDRLLSYGAPPIFLVRRAMLGKDAGPAL